MALKHHREKSHHMSNPVGIFWLGGEGVSFLLLFCVLVFFPLVFVFMGEKKMPISL